MHRLALSIDFMRPAGAGRRIGYALAALGVIASALAVAAFVKLERETSVLARSIEASSGGRTQTSRGRTDPVEGDQLKRRLAAANAVMNRLARPWEKLFADLESAEHAEVGLLGIEPDPRKAEIRISGEARDGAALSTYIASLEGTDSLQGVSLTQHEVVANSGPGVLRFTLVGKWAGAMP